jgi:hypothetical protein
MFRRKKVIHKPSRACAQQRTEVSSQSDEWYRSAYGTNIHTNIHFYVYRFAYAELCFLVCACVKFVLQFIYWMLSFLASGNLLPFLGDSKAGDNATSLSGSKESRKELWEVGLGLVDQLSVAAGVTAKDKRAKDAKNAAAASSRIPFTKKSRSSGHTGMKVVILLFPH